MWVILFFTDSHKNYLINGEALSAIQLIRGIDFYDFILINATKRIELSRLAIQFESLKDVLTETGAIAVRTTVTNYADIKNLMDESFGKKNYLETFVLGRKMRTTKNLDKISRLPSSVEFLLVYRRGHHFYYRNPFLVESKNRDYWTTLRAEEGTVCDYIFEGIKPYHGGWKWEEKRTRRAFENYQNFIKDGNGQSLNEYWKQRRNQYEMENGYPLEFVRKTKSCFQYWTPPQNAIINPNLTNKCIWGINREKNIESMKFLLNIFTDQNSKVLDMNAEEGLLGNALIKLNEETKSRRFFTLITLSKTCYFNLKQQTTLQRIVLQSKSL